MRPRTYKEPCVRSPAALPTGAHRRRTWPWGGPAAPRTRLARLTEDPGSNAANEPGLRTRRQGDVCVRGQPGLQRGPVECRRAPCAEDPMRKLQSPCESQARPCKSVTQPGPRAQGSLRVPLSSGAGAGGRGRPGTQDRAIPSPPFRPGAPPPSPQTQAPRAQRRRYAGHRYAGPASLSFPPEASREKQSLSCSPLLPPR